MGKWIEGALEGGML